jgi:hypothetical protein
MSGDGLQSQVRASSGCFEHDKGGRDGAQPFDERLKPGLIVTDAEGVLTRAGIPTGEGWLYLAVMFVGSMSRQGNCWDNAVAESFLATLKVEHVHDAAWTTQAGARAELIEYLEVFYNGQRRHSAIGYLSPRAFERQREHEALAT